MSIRESSEKTSTNTEPGSHPADPDHVEAPGQVLTPVRMVALWPPSTAGLGFNLVEPHVPLATGLMELLSF